MRFQSCLAQQPVSHSFAQKLHLGTEEGLFCSRNVLNCPFVELSKHVLEVTVNFLLEVTVNFQLRRSSRRAVYIGNYSPVSCRPLGSSFCRPACGIVDTRREGTGS